jgi:phosphatidylserine decarboxylase
MPLPLSRRSWRAARRYAGPPLAAGAALTLTRHPRPGLALLAAGLGTAVFFRDPPRRLDAAPGTAYSAADGYVTLVQQNCRIPWLGRPCTRVSVFLSLQNVHVARAPLAGILEDWQWRDGRCRAALSPRAAEENRQARLLISTPAGDEIGVILAAGMIARRITAWVSPGDKLGAEAGELTRLAVIHFGSRADVLLPAAWTPLVRPGARVRAGITPIARKPARAGPRP